MTVDETRTAFRAWSLPREVEGPGVDASRERLVREGGEARLAYPEAGAVDPRDLRRVLGDAREVALRPRGAAEVATVLGKVGARFLSPGDPLRERALRLLPEHAGLSAPMAREVLDGMAADWTTDRLLRLLRAEFPDPGVLEGFRPGPEARIHARGPSLVVQISSGNVPGVSVGSLLRALLVKSAVLVKPARGDAVLPTLFTEGLREVDPALAGAVAVLYWPGGEKDGVEAGALDGADVVVAYGGLDTIRGLRARIPPTARLVPYHHRVSLGGVGRELLTREAIAGVAARVARAVAMFEQRGCVSPHVIYAEEGGELDPVELAGAVAGALAEESRRVPPGPLGPEEATAAQQLRGTEELREASGAGVRVFEVDAEVDRGTVIYDPDPGFAPSGLARTVRVKPVPALEELGAHLLDVAPYLQSFGLEAPVGRREAIALALADAGVVRVTDLEGLPWPPPWWHHDGGGPLRDLVSWTEMD